MRLPLVLYQKCLIHYILTYINYRTTDSSYIIKKNKLRFKKYNYSIIRILISDFEYTLHGLLIHVYAFTFLNTHAMVTKQYRYWIV